jgi:molybdate transport system ATP-binding protein
VTDVSVRAVVENRGVDLEFAVAASEVLAVLGPNGAGKSTALHVIAGLVRPDDGVVRVGDRVLTDTATGTHVPTHDRQVGLLMQDPLLFPHLSVAANVAFSPRSSRKDAERWLDEVEAGGLADRMPRQLSGGQAQRIALARALAAEPDVLLLDEPLAGLDVGVAAAMRKLLSRVLARDGRSAVLITHDLVDVLTLADTVLILEGGKVVERGSTATVLARPRSKFGARFAGVNLVLGTVRADGVLATPWGLTWHGVPGPDAVADAPAVALFSPAAVAVYRQPPHGSPRNTVEVTVAELDSRGPAIRVRAEEQPDGAPGLAADITADSAADMRLTPGDRVYFSVKAQEVTLLAAP